ncbi:Molybdopterin synthase sulfur carrier subunit [bioreactor metagenome]|uniref:Molybdopterin synthase sulfur carrier subunit n=1 Tax=bioreactor metagenome TaxID=1076179 RepID=A0A645C910_9ZZZZ
MSQETVKTRQVKVLYFASIREAFGTGAEHVETSAVTVGELRDELIRARGEAAASALAPNKAVRMALNQLMCKADAAINDGDEVAFFPPVTGG